jgi:hypothetical protein
MVLANRGSFVLNPLIVCPTFLSILLSSSVIAVPRFLLKAPIPIIEVMLYNPGTVVKIMNAPCLETLSPFSS